MDTSIVCELANNKLFNKQKNRLSDDSDIVVPKPGRKYEPILDEEKRQSRQISNRKYREKNPTICKNATIKWRNDNPTYDSERRVKIFREKYGRDPPDTNANVSKYEQIYRDVFKNDFPDLHVQYNVRPDWLKNKITKSNLEAHFLFEDIKLVVEVQGEQHYKHIPYFHRELSDFFWQKTRDQIKRELCEKNGYKLIEIDARNDKISDVLCKMNEYIDRIKNETA